jgi:hypothetical protein
VPWLRTADMTAYAGSVQSIEATRGAEDGDGEGEVVTSPSEDAAGA